MMDASRSKRRKLAADKKAVTSALPDAVMLDILERLPISDVIRFLGVSRAWRAMIADDPAFARAHLERSRAERRRPLEMPVVSPCSPDSGPFLKLFRYHESGERAKPVSRTLLRFPRSYDRTIVHCDGVLVVCSTAELLAWNPATGESVRLPRGSSHCSARLGGVDRLGFCYDPAARALKVVRYYYRAHDIRAGTYSLGVEILALGHGEGPPTWRPAARDPPCPIYGTTPASVRSTVYWAIDERFLDGGAHLQTLSTFLSMDVTTGEFDIVDEPPCLAGWRSQDVTLANVGGALCVVVARKSQVGTVWLRTAAADGKSAWTWTRAAELDTYYILPRFVAVGMCERTGEMLLLAGRAMHHCRISPGEATVRRMVDVRGRRNGRFSTFRGPAAKELVFMYSPSLIKIMASMCFNFQGHGELRPSPMCTGNQF